MTDILSFSVLRAAKEHAIKDFPRESCGIVIGDEYFPCVNISSTPETDFEISPVEYLALKERGVIRCILHSHPGGPYFPSKRDMQGQLDTAVPWGIIVTDGERASEPTLWGDQLPIAPLIGRDFMHGVHDCYSLLRDAFRVGKIGMAAQEMPEWPHDPYQFPEVPRSDGWWNLEGEDLYSAYFEKTGWRQISVGEARPGDGFLMTIGATEKLNHAGLLVGNNLILHHLPTRPSRREPAGIWARGAKMWLRWERANAP